MEIKIKKLPQNTIELEIELRADEFDVHLKGVEEKFSLERPVAGFRPGKAPAEILRREIGETKIYEKAAEMAIEKTYWQAVREKKMEPVSIPKIEILKLARDNPFIYKATVVLLPKVKMAEFNKIKIKKKKIEISDKEVAKFLDELRASRRKETLVKRPAQKGDRLEMDLEMFFEKVPLEDGRGKNVSYLLGESYYIPGLAEKLMGVKSEEIKEFSLNYPADYYDKKLAGKTIDFKVKVKAIYEIEIPALDNAFAQNLEGFKNLEELKKQLKANLEQEAKLREKERIELEILEKLISDSHFEEIPGIILEEEKEKMLHELERDLESNNLKFDDYLSHLKKTRDDLKKDFIFQAEKRVKTALVIRRVIEDNNFSVSDEELEQRLTELFNYYKYDDEMRKYIRTDDYRFYLKNLMLNRKAIDWLKQKATIEEI